MPELPEVEVVRRSLKASVLGKKIVSFEVVRRPGKKTRVLQNISEEEFRSGVVGASFKDIIRKGKFLIAPLTNGKSIVFHFMLTGWLNYFRSESEADEKTRRDSRLKFSFEDGSVLLFVDSRNMGRVFLVEREDFSQIGVLARIGVEPLSPDFTFERFRKVISESAGKTLKDFLTDQEKIAGIGNIYSDEILRRARLRPDRRVATLTDAEIEKLYEIIPTVLKDGVAEIESGIPGHMLAWRKKGRTCPECGGEVAAVKRGTTHYYWCPSCQR
ncbi:MAG: hypothetical protein K6T91_03800 [Firmicutes bacterium]|nr:hypothetical protein [Bacillota bacterium]